MQASLRLTGHQAIKAFSSQSRAIDVSSSPKKLEKDTRPTVKDSRKSAESAVPEAESTPKKKTMTELDEELKLKLEGISGEGGVSGLEYENGKAAAMKRSGEQKDGHNGTKDTKNEDASNGVKEDEKNAFDEVKADEFEVKEAAKEDEAAKSEQIASNKESVIEDSKREAAMPSSILEKGIIYFFFRGRVNIDQPQGVEDIARSYIVLRPLPIGAKLSKGPLKDAGNARLLTLPKKVLPKSKRDRFLVFVKKQKTSDKDFKENFMVRNYATKTSSTSHTPAATPIAEGIYAITSTGRESHLAYHVTIPDQLEQGDGTEICKQELDDRIEEIID